MNNSSANKPRAASIWQKVEQLFGQPWLVLVLVAAVALASWWLWRGPLQTMRRELRLDPNLVSQEDQPKPPKEAEPILPDSYTVQSIGEEMIALEGDDGIFFVSDPANNLELRRGQPGDIDAPELEPSELAVGQTVRVELLDGSRVRLWLE